jgi:tRNA-Thr(GGU) m(6)t(6)A37 methyltransferase TsaA
MDNTPIAFQPIGVVRTPAQSVPRHWTLSDVRGTLVIDNRFLPGLADIHPGQRIVVLFCFHKSRAFTSADLKQVPGGQSDRSPRGVFSICSPYRPNPIGLSVVTVERVEANRLHVRGLDMFDGTPILDIKPQIESPQQCPSWKPC